LESRIIKMELNALEVVKEKAQKIKDNIKESH
jgi:hypothetical protein